jgi:ABC-2 type transport system ATP-binding protein
VFHRLPVQSVTEPPTTGAPTTGADSRLPTSGSVVEIVGLSKRFGAGVLAVDDLTFSVEAGQVCGLLGPNGAGKTTCLRMLLGLIRPTKGETRLFGTRVAPGSDELRRVGALIESSSFVPHLSGMRNLRLWWEAGGGRWADADVEQALAIADLGAAVDRKVKTYSQGMRQRLGLARVLLGRPEILVLDEPTNGLDPGEMREVRNLVRRVAQAGATVLFSSHVLAEVEQICTHAVVMDKGKLIAAGSVTDLVGSAGVVYLEVDDPDAARRVLGTIAAVRRIDDEAPGLAVHVDGIRRSELVAALVGAGVAVETVTARRRLEEAFLGLVEAG